uniref:Spore germination protein n=1 Tax=Haemonchus contortus TaxID=6289 RepID=A0A7I4YKG7_HAECO
MRQLHLFAAQIDPNSNEGFTPKLEQYDLIWKGSLNPIKRLDIIRPIIDLALEGNIRDGLTKAVALLTVRNELLIVADGDVSVFAFYDQHKKAETHPSRIFEDEGRNEEELGVMGNQPVRPLPKELDSPSIPKGGKGSRSSPMHARTCPLLPQE